MNKNKFKSAIRLIYPARCPGCDGLLSYKQSGRVFCDNCSRDVEPVRGRICFKCGKPIASGFSDLCRDCEESGDTALLLGRGAFIYTGPMKLAMYRLKYSGRRGYAKPLARAAYIMYHDWLDSLGADAIVPIPMYAKKEKKRGYNQAEVFARALSELMSVPMLPDLLVRTRDTIPQKGLDREKRRKNLKNAFKINKSSVKFKCVLIVDDIYTTGATIREAAGVLASEYGCRVYSFCICVGVV